MKLIQIEISNFRSILNQKIDFKDTCIGLIGLNESGKSNILNAIRALEKNYTLTAKDRSKISYKFPTIEYKFDLEQDEILLIEQELTRIIKDEVNSEKPLIFAAENLTTIKRVVKIDRIEDSLKKETYFEVGFDLNLPHRLFSLKEEHDIPDEIVFKVHDEEYVLNTANHIEANLVPKEYHQYYDDFDKSSILNSLNVWANETFTDKFPQIIFWEYQPKYLIPSELTYEELMDNDTPYENSAPLYNILLSTRSLNIKTVEDLKFKVSVWKTDSSERRKDSSIITQNVNTYIKSIWSDYNQDLVIELEETKITIHINDPNSDQKNYYEMEARSQGFKTFISFILTIAAEAENEIVNNFILLLDEPETHLHPSGVRYMREELLKLSKKGNNIIIYSTHSIFMIDRAYLKRHIIVSKAHELTKLTKVERNNFIQEDVIYEAMGTKIDEFSIGVKNIIFEGETDLKIFETLFTQIYNKDAAKPILDYANWDGGGTKRIEQFLSVRSLPNKSEWIAILDNDSPGRELGKLIDTKLSKLPHLKLRYTHYSTIQNFELEDILPKEILQKAFNGAVEKLAIELKYAVDFSKATKSVSAITEEFKAKHSLNAAQKNLFEEYFKTEIDTSVDHALIKILAIPEQEKKITAFKETFHLYYEFIQQFIDKFFKSSKKVLFPEISDKEAELSKA